MPTALQAAVCADCADTTSSLLEIRRRYLCHACFSRYVYAKLLKRMEAYSFKHQVGDQRRKLLLPLSGGISSLVVLHVLDAQLKRQNEKLGRTAYDIIIVRIKIDESDEVLEAWQTSIRAAFDRHKFLPYIDLKNVLEHDRTLEADLRSLGLIRDGTESNTDLLLRLFSSTKTISAKADLQTLLLDRLVVAVAKEEGCEGIVWGHSDSRLAAKALADVAKGRGGSVSSAITDGLSAWGINFTYPARELYKTELELYLKNQLEDLSGCVYSNSEASTPSASIRNTSIDDLLSGYISSQGVKYPSIMANVVRTTGKLQTRSVNAARICKLCSMPIENNSKTDDLCYGCNRMKQDIKT